MPGGPCSTLQRGSKHTMQAHGATKRHAHSWLWALAVLQGWWKGKFNSFLGDSMVQDHFHHPCGQTGHRLDSVSHPGLLQGSQVPSPPSICVVWGSPGRDSCPPEPGFLATSLRPLWAHTGVAVQCSSRVVRCFSISEPPAIKVKNKTLSPADVCQQMLLQNSFCLRLKEYKYMTRFTRCLLLLWIERRKDSSSSTCNFIT